MKNMTTKKKILIGAIALVVALLAGGGIWAATTWHAINNDQMGLFDQTPAPTESINPETEPPTEEPTNEPTESASPTPVPTPTPTLSPYDELASQADTTIMKDTLNILLVGVDYSQERVGNTKQYVNKDFNSDVMLILAINFKQKKVDMISLPRDSYAKIANLTGVYKLNFALEAGGGMNDKGFMNVCKSAQAMIGNIPVNYYIAVTMPVVKELTDAIGGVEYDMDIDFSIQGRNYKKGKQHMDGQGVLDYCRIRKGDIKSSEAGDLHRVDRQKKMLLTVFKKLQNESTILDVPQMLLGMQGKVFTNMNFQQLAALAVFGKDLDQEKISLHTMPGSYNYGIFNRNYVIIDQAKRVQLIKSIYGIDVKQQYKYSSTNARLYWAWLQGEAWIKEIKGIMAADAKLPDDQKKLKNQTYIDRTNAAMATLQSKLKKYEKKAKGANAVKKSEMDDLESAVKGFYDNAYLMCYKAGIRADWDVAVYTKGEPHMKE